jgi:transposase-like protein
MLTSWQEPTVVIMVVDVERIDADLAAGRVACPGCGTALWPWSYARVRTVRQLDGSGLRLRPRRARCRGCGRTQVLLPGSVLPRRADATAVIGAALAARVRGLGSTAIAALVRRPVSTVRRWLARARGEHLSWLRRRGVGYAVDLDPQVMVEEGYQPGELGQALSALVAAAIAWRRRFGTAVEMWTLIGVFTAGRLLTPV